MWLSTFANIQPQETDSNLKAQVVESLLEAGCFEALQTIALPSGAGSPARLRAQVGLPTCQMCISRACIRGQSRTLNAVMASTVIVGLVVNEWMQYFTTAVVHCLHIFSHL